MDRMSVSWQNQRYGQSLVVYGKIKNKKKIKGSSKT